MKKKPILSILVGSGFSIPGGLPSVPELNKRLSKIDESEILISTCKTTIFLIEKDGKNRKIRRYERIFLQEFLEFYNADVLKQSEKFHYETFYDFYSGYLTINNKNKEAIEKFYKLFNEKHFNGSDNNRDCYNRISDFNRSYSQLLASLLQKTIFFEDISSQNYLGYEPFIVFLKELLKTNDIKFHSLNHDLLFDWLAQNHQDLKHHFTDGFQLAGSPFYGIANCNFKPNSDKKIYKEFYVKLEQFIDKFDKPLSLFKLHGSVMNTIVHTTKPDKPRLRVKDYYGVTGVFKEFTDINTGEQRFEEFDNEVAPDFLSGTKNKILYYTGDTYYVKLLKHFEKNLLSSELLVVIGYGFKDSEINKYLEKHFLSLGKHMVVIDPKEPETDLLMKYKATYIEKGVTDLIYQEYLEQILAKLKHK